VWSGPPENRDAGNGLFDAVEPATIFSNRVACVLDLTATGFPAQLRGEFEDLCKPGGPDRMSLGFQSAGWIDGDCPAQRCSAGLGEGTAGPKLAKSEILDLLELGKGGGVMYLGDIHIVGAQPGNFIGIARSPGAV